MSSTYSMPPAQNRDARRNVIGNAINEKRDKKGHWENFLLRGQEYRDLSAAGVVSYNMTCEEEFQAGPLPPGPLPPGPLPPGPLPPGPLPPATNLEESPVV